MVAWGRQWRGTRRRLRTPRRPPNVSSGVIGSTELIWNVDGNFIYQGLQPVGLIDGEHEYWASYVNFDDVWHDPAVQTIRVDDSQAAALAIVAV